MKPRKPLKRTRIKAKRMTPVKRTKSKHKLAEKANDALWAFAVKLRAGNRSEYSGQEGPLHAHHINGKPNYRLRYELSNGIALTPGEHKFIAHNTGRYEEFREFVKRVRGQDIFEKLQALKWDQNKTDLSLVKVYLENYIKGFEDGTQKG